MTHIRVFLLGTALAACTPALAGTPSLFLENGAAGNARTAGPAAAGSLVTFEGNAQGAAPGSVNADVTFDANWIGCVDSDAGGGCNIANEPSPSTVVPLVAASGEITFTTPVNGVGFHYSLHTGYGAATVDAYDSSDTLLESVTLDTCGSSTCGAVCSGDPTGDFCLWTPVTLSASGIKRITINGPAGLIGIDDLSYSTAAAVPGPGPLALAALTLGLGFSAFRARRR